MTLRELSQLYWLKKEIETEEQRLAELRAELTSLRSPDLSAPAVQRGSHESSVERAAVEIVTIEELIRKKRADCIAQKIRLEQYITKIPDSLTRQIFTLRFVEGCSWVQVSHRIGGGITDSGVKMICYRYLKEKKKKSCVDCVDDQK